MKLYLVQFWDPQYQAWVNAKECDGVLCSYSSWEIAAFIATSAIMNFQRYDLQIHHHDTPPHDLDKSGWWRVEETT